ncbi:AAA-like domain-containing protein [Planktothrix paucivesiculata]|uniref:YD repeat protein n=1 Tax=Planktothrix paucivesiculata PCC 9631 TaxID=671071 RepID=A0A7Z9E4U8_9CYAN|nr:AAA-like domain-containing protein [Planktothrix paucivesiculata]VXD23202.1 YD repeat protein [Planktothrix paucivesiculata PCC 9631]
MELIYHTGSGLTTYNFSLVPHYPLPITHYPLPITHYLFSLFPISMTLYKVGGSLEDHDPTYVIRSSDQHLYHALKAGQFCYVFNSRQMGKSSLMVRTKHQLEAEGYACTVIDMTLIGSQDTTPLQWYKGIAMDLLRGFRCLDKLNFKVWWQEQEGISLLQKLSEFLEILLIQQFPKQNLCIFIDEIDSILSLDFPTDDFFALIRACYNERAINPEYKRLTFALFGVATPSDLIADKNRTPFNIGTAINLTGFTLEESTPLVQGLTESFAQPEVILQEILTWTNGQPFLTQKLLKLVVLNHQQKKDLVAQNSPRLWIKKIVRSQIIEKWESQDEPEHLRTIRDRLFHNSQQTGRLLGIYQTILQETKIQTDESPEQVELLLSGLVLKDQGYLKVRNPIYKEVFNLVWVQQQLAKLRPYSQTFDVWITSCQQDESRLLRGQALKDAQIWSQGKSLSDLDYQFLAASVEADRKEVQISLEAERAKAIEAQLTEEKQRLLQEQKTAKLQRLLLGAITMAFLLASGLGLFAFKQYKEAKVSEIKALTSSSESLLGANRQLDAMIAAIKAKRKLESLGDVDYQTTKNVETVLNQAVYGSYEFNRLNGHKDSVMAVAISPDLQLIATGGEDQTARIWKPDGSILHILKHSGAVWRVVFNPDSNLIVSASLDGSVKLWRVDGTLIQSFQAHQGPAWGVAFSPDGQLIASAGGDSKVKLWTLDGQLLKTFIGHQNFVRSVAFSPDGKMIASGGGDNTIKLWSVDGRLLKTLEGHQKNVWHLSFCPSKNLLISASQDLTAKLWKLDGTLVKTITNDRSFVGVDCQDKQIATIDEENTIKTWNFDGTFIEEFNKFRSFVGYVAISLNGLIKISANNEGVIKLWHLKHNLLKLLTGHQNTIWDVATSRDGQLIASTSVDQTLKLWRSDGTLLQTLKDSGSPVFRSVVFSQDSQILVTGSLNQKVQLWDISNPETSKIKLLKTLVGHQAPINALAISPDGKMIASGDHKTIKIWNFEGKLLHSFPAHNEIIWKLAFSNDGQFLASASADRTAKIWQLEGQLVATLPHNSSVWGVAFSPQNNFVVTSSRDDTLKFWQLDGILINSISGEGKGFNRLAISPDGQTIATAGVDTNVKLWSATGDLLATLPGHQRMVFSVAFTADGNSLVSGSDDRTLIIWDLKNIRALNQLNYACDWVKDYLRTNINVEESDRSLCK